MLLSALTSVALMTGTGTAAGGSPAAAGADPANVAGPASNGSSEEQSNDSLTGDFFASWRARVELAKDTQPDWVPPLMTLSPLITELLRWDSGYENLGRGAHLLNLGASKGLFLVPSETNEVDIGIPSYEERYGANPAAGLSDFQFLLVKQRLLSAADSDDDYILTTALSAQAPIGAPAFTSRTYVVTPYLLGGKGFGNLDFQAATGLSIPTGREGTLGTSWATNLTAQYRVAHMLWPEAELNWTHWLGGMQRAGLNQLYVTLGLIVAPIPVSRDVRLTFGAGFQFAVAPGQIESPVPTPTYRNSFVFTGRVLF
jgi:hypothetical protein